MIFEKYAPTALLVEDLYGLRVTKHIRFFIAMPLKQTATARSRAAEDGEADVQFSFFFWEN